MFSKNTVYAFVASLLSLSLLVGCSLRTGDKGEPQRTVTYSELECLGQISKQVNRYVSGEMTKPEVIGFFICIRQALHKFAFYSEGQRKDGFHPSELTDFLNEHFMKENKISAAFTREAMNLKVLLTGGSAEFVTRAEFEDLIEVIGIVGEEAERHLPYIALYGIGSNVSAAVAARPVTREQVHKAQSALRATAQRVSDVFVKSKFTYRLGSMQAFIEEIRNLLEWKQHHKHVFESKDLVQLIGAYKNMLTGTSSEQIEPEDWQSLLLSTADVFGLVIEFQSVIRKEESFQGPALTNFVSYTERVLTVVQNSIQKQPNSVITFKSFENLIDSLEKIKFLPLGLKATSIKPILYVVVGRVLRDPTLRQGGRVEGLTMPALNEARKEFYIWSDSQSYISEMANRAFKLKGILPTTNTLNEKDLAQLFNIASLDPRVEHITYIVKNVRPLFRDKDSRVWLIPDAEREKYQVRHNLNSLSRLNFFGSLMRLVTRGFATNDRIVRMAGVTIEELESFYQTFRAFGTDIKLLDPRSKEVGIRSFREGNMFTFAGNGVQIEGKNNEHLLTFIEGIELFTFIWSGSQVKSQIYDNGLSVCAAPKNAKLDIFGNVKLDRECFFKHFIDKRYIEFSNMPNMRNYIWSLKPEVREAFYEGLENVARIRCEDPRYLEQTELTTIATVLHYMESLFVTYDRDRSGVLDGREVMAAFPRFHIFLAEQVTKIKKKTYDIATMKAIFTFLARESRFPSDKLPGSIADKAAIAANRLRYFDQDSEQFVFARVDEMDEDDRPAAPNLSLTRTGLLRVLAMLNSVSKDDTEACPANK